MLQRSKLIRSRDEWKRKAVQRAHEVRELKKTRKRLKEKIAQHGAQRGVAEQAAKNSKKNR